MAKLSDGRRLLFIPPFDIYVDFVTREQARVIRDRLVLLVSWSSFEECIAYENSATLCSRLKENGMYRGKFCRGGEAKRGSTGSMEQRTRVNSCFVRFVFLTRVNVRCQETSMCVLVSRDSCRSRLVPRGDNWRINESPRFHSSLPSHLCLLRIISILSLHKLKPSFSLQHRSFPSERELSNCK